MRIRSCLFIFVLNFYNEKATIRNRRRPGFFSRKYGVDFVRACPVKECVGLTHFQTKEIIIIYTAVIPCLPGVYTVCNARVGMALVPLQTVTSVVFTWSLPPVLVEGQEKERCIKWD